MDDTNLPNPNQAEGEGEGDRPDPQGHAAVPANSDQADRLPTPGSAEGDRATGEDDAKG